MEIKPNEKIPVTLFVEDLETASILIKMARDLKIPAYKNDEIEKSLSTSQSDLDVKKHQHILDLSEEIQKKKEKPTHPKSDEINPILKKLNEIAASNKNK